MTRQLLAAVVLSLASLTASARDTGQACAHVLPTGQPTTQPAGRTQLLCYRAYAVLYSSQTRTALWSAERLTREAVDAARKLPRDSDFYEEERLPEADRARLADYRRGSGMDRGPRAATSRTRRPKPRASASRTLSPNTACRTAAPGVTSRRPHAGWPASTVRSRW